MYGSLDIAIHMATVYATLYGCTFTTLLSLKNLKRYASWTFNCQDCFLRHIGVLPRLDYSYFGFKGKFDVIHVGAAASFQEVLKLLDLLKLGGAMIVPQYDNDGQSDSQVSKPLAWGSAIHSK